MEKEVLNFIERIKPIILAIKNEGGIPYLVGGSVRDFVMGREIKDIDIEVHNMSIESLEKCLKKFGPVSLVGKQFGVLKSCAMDIDWSMPRRDSKGRKPSIIVDSGMTIKEACRRRDVTMNAMAIDLGAFCETGKREIIDPYHGQADIKAKTLKAVDKELFIDDPLRFYRVMQFVGRFEMEPDSELNEICKKMDLREVVAGGELARERIYEELKKLFLKSERPSLGFRWVQKIGRLKELFPEVGELVGVEQRSDFHPEGDVFEHTMQALDAIALFELGSDEKFMLMLATLCHDFGKVKTSDERGRAKGHDEAGVPLAKSFLQRFTWDSVLIRSVCKLVRYHRSPWDLVKQKSGVKAYKKLALHLAPEVTPRQLSFVALADSRGRNAKSSTPLSECNNNGEEILKVFMQNVENAKVEHGPEQPVLQGRDLLGIVEPGPAMGRLLKKAYDIQIDEGVTDKEELKKRVLDS
jgi:tRNA nucleotidyltransferase (CCA-adding enzyme)